MKKTAKPKHVKVTHAHHKPYRKRHYALLIASIALGIALINSLVLYANHQYVSGQIASQTIADLFGSDANRSDSSTVASTYGFSLSYNTNRYYASAVDAVGGELYVGAELDKDRAYNAIRLSEQGVNAATAGSFKLMYYQADKPTSNDLAALETAYIVQKQTDPTKLKKDDTGQRTYDGVSFQRTQWHREVENNGVDVKVSFTTYVGLVNGSPLTVIASDGVSGKSNADEIMKTFAVSSRLQAAHTMPTTVASKYNSSLILLESMLGTATASAAAPSYTAAERISATYGPAVVKIYNVQAGDLAIDGQVVVKDHIAGGTGSGFIVSSEGHIATNGHVAVIDARDEIITIALTALYGGNSGPMLELLKISGTTDADVAGAKSDEEVLKIVIEDLYELPNKRFTFVNSQQNLLVGLGEKQVDVQELVTATTKKQVYPNDDTIKPANLLQSDYDGTILPLVTGKFTKSDVALIKISGENYPMVQLGSLSSISQGGNLNIMGFPGIGSSNGVVSETKTAATLTTGKVSAKKKDTGNRNLLETDTEIGHGNSGGPAFDDQGEVVGIATYAVDPGNAGDGTLNYVRDVADFMTTAEKSSVDYTTSETQETWDKGIEQFYTARYKKAVASFAEVKELYPQHPRVAELTAVAEKRIANGENVDDFPVVPVVILAVVALLGIGIGVFFIVRHKRGHNALVQGVVSGQVQPMAPGAPAQTIPAATAPAQLFAQAPVAQPTQLAQPPVVAAQPVVQQPVASQQFGQPTVTPVPVVDAAPVQTPAPQPFGAPSTEQPSVTEEAPAATPTTPATPEGESDQPPTSFPPLR